MSSNINTEREKGILDQIKNCSVKQVKQLLHEEQLMKRNVARFIPIQSLLTHMHFYCLGKNTILTSEISNLKMDLLTFKKLEFIYSNLVFRLNKEFVFQMQSKPTIFERKSYRLIKKLTKAKCHKSFWIKNFCVDFYFPRFNLALEVDGSIHDNEIKMKKDNYKDKKLANNYNMIVSHFDNSNTSDFILKVMAQLDSSHKKNSKNIKQTLTKIYIDTIAYHCTLNELTEHLGEDFRYLFQRFFNIDKPKRSLKK